MAMQGGGSGGFEEYLGQHRELRALLARIDEAFQRPSSSMEEISQLLGQLGDRLVYHFTCEEEGGYFSEALLHAPQLVAKANALLDQHPKMCTKANALKVELHRAQASTEEWRTRTAELFVAFREELLRHEMQENVLLQEAYQRDIGIND